MLLHTFDLKSKFGPFVNAEIESECGLTQVNYLRRSESHQFLTMLEEILFCSTTSKQSFRDIVCNACRYRKRIDGSTDRTFIPG